MRKRGWGSRRYAAIAAIALVMCVSAPELAAPAGAVAPRTASRSELQARPAARSALHARKRRRKVRKVRRLRPISAAKKQALLQHYIRTHPGVVAAHARTPNATLATKLKTAAYLRAHPHKEAKPHKKAKKAKKAAKVKKTAVRKHRPKAAGAKKKPLATKKKKKAATASGWRRDAMMVGGLGVAAVALFLIGSSVLAGPRSRARARARRRQRALVPR